MKRLSVEDAMVHGRTVSQTEHKSLMGQAEAQATGDIMTARLFEVTVYIYGC